MVQIAAKITGVGPACAAIGWSRAHYYRLQKPPAAASPAVLPASKPRQASALTPDEVAAVIALLNSERFLDYAPREVWATLLDEGIYLCSWRTMYRLLTQNAPVQERRQIRRHPKYSRHELEATGPNQVWTWDITYLKGPIRGQFFYLYVAMDIFSRLVVGWLVANEESAELAKRLFEKSFKKHGVQPGKLTLHADRGAPMKNHTIEKLLKDMQVSISHSRPRVSNDNCYSEAGFKTMKYSVAFPGRFDSAVSVTEFCKGYFHWYNNQHHHSGIVYMTPAQVHYGEVEAVTAQRQDVMDEIFILHPERFRKGRPITPPLPEMVWINKPAQPVEKAAA